MKFWEGEADFRYIYLPFMRGEAFSFPSFPRFHGENFTPNESIRKNQSYLCYRGLSLEANDTIGDSTDRI